MREKVGFEPGKEIEKDVFSSFHECETKEKRVPARNRTSDLRCSTTEPQKLYSEWGPSGSSYMKRVLRVYITGSLIPFTNVTVATSLILTVRRQRVLLELLNGPRSPWSLSVVEHRSAESEDLKFDSSKGLTIFFFVSRLWQDKNIILQIYVLILDCYYNQQRDIVTVQGLQV